MYKHLMRSYEERALKRLRGISRELNDFTAGARIDMHEPDEQGIYANIFNPFGTLDNAFGADPKYGEIIVALTKEENSIRINLADLIALARLAEV